MTKVVIALGSKSDLQHANEIRKTLGELGLPSQIRVSSAHKIPDHTLKLINEYENEDVIFIAIAGRSNALGGLLDANTRHVVINCPPYSEKFAGADIYSSLRMPSGLSCTTAIEPEQAALACVKIAARTDKNVSDRLMAFREKKRKELLDADRALKGD